ncbi:MAG TPA: hypothetical protein VN372_05430 [Methanospirillum sp.]|nr:hypothetical protein [Methanospirillum sp.]
MYEDSGIHLVQEDQIPGLNNHEMSREVVNFLAWSGLVPDMLSE